MDDEPKLRPYILNQMKMECEIPFQKLEDWRQQFSINI